MADGYTIPIYDPDGVLRDIPAEQAHAAVAAGGKPGVRFQAPDGKIRYVPADQTQDALSNGGKLLPFEQQDEGIKKWYGLTPSNVAQNAWQGFKGIIGGTYDVAKDLVNNPNWVQGPDSTFHKFIQAPADEQVAKASKALEAGNRVEAAGHILASALPLVGPWAAGLGEQAGKGDIGGAIGQAAGTVAGGAAMSAAAGGLKAAVPKAGELVKAGTGELVKATGATIAPTPTEALTTALTRGQLRTTKGVDMAPVIDSALPDLKRAEAASGAPVTSVDHLISRVNEAKKAVWQEYQSKLEQAQAVDAGPLQTRDPVTGRLNAVTREPTINGNEIADAMMNSIDKRQATLNPNLEERIKAMADTYRRPMKLGEAEDFLQSANNDLNTYYAKNKVGRRVALGDPDIASTVAEADQLRDSLYSKLDELTGPGAADIKQRYGALSSVEEAALRARATQARQSPMSLSEQISTARGLGKVAVGGLATAGGLAFGEPHTIGGGLALAGGGLMEAGVGRWLKARQTTDALIQKAFEDYGKPPSALRTLISGTRGEAGAPGTVREEDVGQAVPPVEAMRRTPEQTRADIQAAINRDPAMAEVVQHEANMRQRAAEAQAQREALGPLTRPAERPIIVGPETKPNVPSPYEKYGQAQTVETPNAPAFYSKAEQAARTLPASASGQQMLATLRNQGVKPGELEQLGIEDFLKGKPKFTRQEVADFVARNKLQVGQKDLKTNTQLEAEGRTEPGGATRYDSYTLPGEKRNYTERLLTLPYEKKGMLPALPGESTIDTLNRSRAENPVFRSSHWDEPNVLAHARFDERTAADGKKVLFMEEAQSDWHQQGKREGYAATDEWKAGTKFHVEPAGGNTYNVVDENGRAWAAVTNRATAEQRAQEFEQRGGIPAGSKNIGVPDAPFKTDWHELVVKNMLREAAERGADRLAWTTGDQQAERYDLSKATGRLHYNAANNDLIVYDPQGKNVVRHVEVTPDKLPDVIGKDPAQKILAQPKMTGGWQAFTGPDLKVGGEWAKALYDRAIPNFLNKYAKKWGARVGESDLQGEEGPQEREYSGPTKTVDDIAKVPWRGTMYEGSFRELLTDLHRGIPFKDAANNLSEGAAEMLGGKINYSKPTQTHKVHSIDITPAMRKAVLKEGQPIASAKTFGEERAG